MSGTDLISRQGMWNSLNEFRIKKMIEGKDVSLVWECIDKVLQEPSAQTKIIRCEECEHWDTTWQNDYAPNYHYCPMIDGACKDDFYCADAERKTDDKW